MLISLPVEMKYTCMINHVSVVVIYYPLFILKKGVSYIRNHCFSILLFASSFKIGYICILGDVVEADGKAWFSHLEWFLCLNHDLIFMHICIQFSDMLIHFSTFVSCGRLISSFFIHWLIFVIFIYYPLAHFRVFKNR